MVIIKEKNQKIQILRAIAIIAVIMIHTCPNGELQVYIRPFINFAVALFLFLSGYLTNIDISDWKAFYKKRIIRVIIPYIIWTFLYTTAHFIGNGIELKKYIINLLSTKAAPTLYYIFVYIQFVIMTPFLGKLAKSKYKWFGFIIAPISVIIKYYWLFSGVEPNKYSDVLWRVCCLGWFTYYYIGLLLGNKIIKKEYNIKKLIILYLLSIFVQMIEGYAWFKLGEVNCGTQIKLSSFLTSSIFILIAYWYLNNKQLIKTNKILIKIGDYSFGIYISHIMIMMILGKIPIYSQIPFCLNSIIVLIITMLCVLIVNKICSKKTSKWLGLY